MARERHTMLMGALVIAGAVALRAAPAVVQREQALRDRVRSRAVIVASLGADLGRMRELEDSASGVKAALLKLAPRLVAGSTRREAEATMASLVRATAERIGASVHRTTAQPDSTTIGALQRLTVRVECDTDAEGLGQLLASLATGDPMLEVDSLRVTADAGTAAEHVERVRVELLVRGWAMRRDAPATREAS
jgi:hypothetical protein